jgi:hypothetical protein
MVGWVWWAGYGGQVRSCHGYSCVGWDGWDRQAGNEAAVGSLGLLNLVRQRYIWLRHRFILRSRTQKVCHRVLRGLKEIPGG